MHLTACYLTYVFQSESTLYSCLNVKELFAWNRCDIKSFKWLQLDSNPQPLSLQKKLNHLAKWAKWLSCVVSTSLYGLTVCSCHFTYAFQSESTLYSYLNVKELFAGNRCDIRSLSVCCRTQTHNHLVCKQTLNQLAKLTKKLSYVVSTYLYDAFDSMLLSCHVRLSEWIHLSQEFLDIQETIEWGFTLKCIHDMLTTYNQKHSVDKHS